MKTPARLLLTFCSLLFVAGCTTAPPRPPMPSAADLFVDTTFKKPASPVSADDLFRLSAPMQAYLRSNYFANLVRTEGGERGMMEALYKKGELKLEYDAEITRNAAETFESKKGNCLALVIMTAAFAKELGLNFEFQNVLVDEQWSRNDSMYFATTHVNLRFAIRQDRGWDSSLPTMTVDFMPPKDAASLRTRSLDEQTIVAMYLNNRAVEELAANRIDSAYWWARAAIEKDPAYITAYNTLGVIYQRHGDNRLAEQVYKRALEREREDTIVMHNLVPVLAKLGKPQESAALAARLKTIQPTPPFYYFEKGLKAMETGQYADAKSMFERELARSPFYHEFHFWLGLAHWRLGEARAARDELALAVDTSTTPSATKLYTGKLDYLRSMAAASRKAF